MIDVIKSVLDPNNSYSLTTDNLTVISGIVFVVVFVLTIKFLFDFVKGLFPSLR